MVDRYRLSDKGILMIFDPNDRRFYPTECFDTMKYCSAECHLFKLGEKSVTLECEPKTVIELEE